VYAENPIRREDSELPNAHAAMPPGYWQLAREWRTVAEYVAASRAVKNVSGWPQGDGHPVVVLPGFLAGGPSTRRRSRRFTGRQIGVKTLLPAAVGSSVTKAEPSRKSWII